MTPVNDQTDTPLRAEVTGLWVGAADGFADAEADTLGPGLGFALGVAGRDVVGAGDDEPDGLGIDPAPGVPPPGDDVIGTEP